MLGTVEKYIKDQGYGFILLKHPIGSGEGAVSKVFFHIRGVENEEEMEPGWLVRFRIDQNHNDPNKLIAAGIRVLSKDRMVEVPCGVLETLVGIARDTDLEDEAERQAMVTAERLLNPKDSNRKAPRNGNGNG